MTLHGRAPKSRKRIPLDEDLILSWADAYYQRTGEWPKQTSGEIPESPGENWRKIDNALNYGLRGLLMGSSLALLLQERRGVYHFKNQERLSRDQILAWADAFFENEGHWPNQSSGPVAEKTNLNWRKINNAMHYGLRGLEKGTSLAQLFEEERGAFNKALQPELTCNQILERADQYQLRHGNFPACSSGVVDDAPNERWNRIDNALRLGLRGLPKGSSLATLLLKERGRRHKGHLPRYDIKQILIWADAHYAATGQWPVQTSGPLLDAPNEKWSKIDNALRNGLRGLPGGSSLAQLLAEQRHNRNEEKN
jgi:hypothetical protein